MNSVRHVRDSRCVKRKLLNEQSQKLRVQWCKKENRTYRIHFVSRTLLLTVRCLYLSFADLGSVNVLSAYSKVKMVSDLQNFTKVEELKESTGSDYFGCQG